MRISSRSFTYAIFDKQGLRQRISDDDVRDLTRITHFAQQEVFQRLSNQNDIIMSAAMEAANDYKSCLDELTFDNKRLIRNLTMLAEANEDHAKHIVKVIEGHIMEVMSFFHK